MLLTLVLALAIACVRSERIAGNLEILDPLGAQGVILNGCYTQRATRIWLYEADRTARRGARNQKKIGVRVSNR